MIINNKLTTILGIILSFNLGCKSDIDERESIAINFPTIVIEQAKDTLKIGEVFEARVYLSDSAFLEIVNEDGSKGRKIFPIFKLNGKEIRNKSDYLIVSDTVNNKIVYKEYPFYREIECSIIFPHPRFAEGSVELHKLITYIALE
jgi:hypothetical protein